MSYRSLHFRLVAWYALWLAGVFIISGALLYLGLRHYVENSLGARQMQRAQRIAALLLRTNFPSDRAIADEITTRFAPEVGGRFVRVSKANGTVIYQSNKPQDQSFDPAQIPPPTGQAGTRKASFGRGSEFMLATVVAGSTGNPRFLVETGESLASALSELHRLLFSLGLGFLLVVGMALGGGSILVRRALRPMETIMRSAERITSHNLSERLPVPPTGDEFERLSRALNRMIARLDEALQYNRRFLADASHELRTPLTVLRGELESFVQEGLAGSEACERLGSALEEVERLANIVEGLFAIARLDAGEAQSESKRVDLGQLVASTAEQMFLLAEDKGIEVTCSTAKGVCVQGDRSRLKQVVVNLLDNAIKYTPRGGRVDLAVQTQDGKAVVEVADNGIGIPDEAQPHVFERFFRVDKARSREFGGAGLGLSIVKSICTAHRGCVAVRSAPGQGSRFKVELPLDAAAKENKPTA